MNIKRIVNILYRKVIEIIDPVKRAKLEEVNFGSNLHIYGHIKWGSEPWIISIGDNVHLTDGVRFVTHDGGTLILRDEFPDLELTKPITIGSNVYIGVDTILLPGVSIGDNVIIGAKSVVTKDIPSNSVAVGQPAKVIKTLDEYKTKACRDSLHLGHLKGKEKDIAIRKYYESLK